MAKVLIVDDKQSNLFALENVLKGLDVEVIQALTGNDALRATLSHDFALAILDVQMPEMDGYELAGFLRSDDRTRNIPIIFLSAVYSADTYVFKGYESGAVDFITKPFSSEILLSKVKVFLELYEQRMRLIGQTASLKALVSQLEEQVQTCRRMEQEVLRKSTVLEGINKMLRETILCETEEQVATACLEVAEQITGSSFGFIGEIDEKGLFYGIALSDPGWAACRVPKSEALLLVRNLEIRGLWGRVLKDGKSLIANDPSGHPDSTGVPEGHPPITTFIGVPLKEGEKTFGMIALANKAPGYDDFDRQALEHLAVAFVEALSRKKAQEALKKAYDELEVRVQERTGELVRTNQILEEQAELLDLAHDAILVRNVEGRIVYWNNGAAELLGFTREQAMGRISHALLKTSFPESLEKITERASNAGRWEGELRHTTAAGKEIVVESRWALQTGKDGQPTGFLEINRDITSRKYAEEELSRYTTRLELMNQQLQEFAFIASHDLQEPLRKIQTFGDRLRNKCMDRLNEKEKDYLVRMESAAGRMQQLIRDLLKYSRVTARLEPFGNVDLKAVVSEVVQVFELRLKQMGARVQVSDLPEIEADATQMKQLFQNLLGNALKFQKDEEKPLIKIHGALVGNDTCQIVIEDNGIGFDEKYLDRIFSPFQRLHGRHEFEGTGMGLAICRKIVEQHGGKITAKSTPGEGSRFIVTLPVRQPAA